MILFIFLIFTFASAQAVTRTVVNGTQQKATLNCQSGEYVQFVGSEHISNFEESFLEFECHDAEAETLNCEWSSWVNDVNQLLVFTCPSHKAITGINSLADHNTTNQSFQFLCCDIQGKEMKDCVFTDQAIELDKRHSNDSSGKVLKGAVSYDNTCQGERRWKYFVCHLESGATDMSSNKPSAFMTETSVMAQTNVKNSTGTNASTTQEKAFDESEASMSINSTTKPLLSATMGSETNDTTMQVTTMNDVQTGTNVNTTVEEVVRNSSNTSTIDVHDWSSTVSTAPPLSNSSSQSMVSTNKTAEDLKLIDLHSNVTFVGPSNASSHEMLQTTDRPEDVFDRARPQVVNTTSPFAEMTPKTNSSTPLLSFNKSSDLWQPELNTTVSDLILQYQDQDLNGMKSSNESKVTVPSMVNEVNPVLGVPDVVHLSSNTSPSFLHIQELVNYNTTQSYIDDPDLLTPELIESFRNASLLGTENATLLDTANSSLSSKVLSDAGSANMSRDGIDTLPYSWPESEIGNTSTSENDTGLYSQVLPTSDGQTPSRITEGQVESNSMYANETSFTVSEIMSLPVDSTSQSLNTSSMVVPTTYLTVENELESNKTSTNSSVKIPSVAQTPNTTSSSATDYMPLNMPSLSWPANQLSSLIDSVSDFLSTGSKTASAYHADAQSGNKTENTMVSIVDSSSPDSDSSPMSPRAFSNLTKLPANDSLIDTGNANTADNDQTTVLSSKLPTSNVSTTASKSTPLPQDKTPSMADIPLNFTSSWPVENTTNSYTSAMDLESRDLILPNLFPKSTSNNQTYIISAARKIAVTADFVNETPEISNITHISDTAGSTVGEFSPSRKSSNSEQLEQMSASTVPDLQINTSSHSLTNINLTSEGVLEPSVEPQKILTNASKQDPAEASLVTLT